MKLLKTELNGTILLTKRITMNVVWNLGTDNKADSPKITASGFAPKRSWLSFTTDSYQRVKK